MTILNILIVLAVSFVIVLGLFFTLLSKYLNLELKYLNKQTEFEEKIENLKTDYENKVSQKITIGIQKSKEVIRGKVTEELLPLLPGFPYQLSDCKFFGSPIDYIVFKNMSNYRDGINTDPVDIIIADVKNNKSSNTPIQNQIKKAIIEKRFTFESWLIDDQNNITIKKY